MAREMADVTREILEQNFVHVNMFSQHALGRLQGTTDNISEQTKLNFLIEGKQVGVREAKAMQTMDADKLASQILQQRSARDQPGYNVEVGKS